MTSCFLLHPPERKLTEWMGSQSKAKLCLIGVLAVVVIAALTGFGVRQRIKRRKMVLDHEIAVESDELLAWLRRGGGKAEAVRLQNFDHAGDAVRGLGATAAIAKGTVKREDLFITTKISPKQCTREAALAAVQEDIKELGGLTPDLVLHHFPCERHHASGSNVKLWQGLQDALKQGLTRSIGVSNYLEEHLTPVLAAGGVPPAVNQCQMSIGSHDDATIAFCKAHNITYEAYSPLKHLDFSDPRITAVASAHKVQPAAVALRWINQQGVVVATSPGSNREYAVEDLAIGDFTLTDDEMAALSKI